MQNKHYKEKKRFLAALSKVVKPESIPAWLHKKNAAFDNQTPLQIIESGATDRLMEMIHDMESGQPE